MNFTKYLIVLLLFVNSANAQLADSLRTTRSKEIGKSLIVPGVLALGGLTLNKNGCESFKTEFAEELREQLPRFRTTLDNHLIYALIAIVYALDAAGIKAKNDFANRTALLIKGEIMMYVPVEIIKRATKQLRPDASNNRSYPSGHTAQAFAAATFLSEEFKDKIPWMPYAAYSMAGTVGMLRMANNKHYISDVLLGAAIGIIAMKVSYWTHKHRW